MSHRFQLTNHVHQLEEKNKAMSKSKSKKAAAKKDTNEYIRTETAVWSTEWSGTEEVLYYPLTESLSLLVVIIRLTETLF